MVASQPKRCSCGREFPDHEFKILDLVGYWWDPVGKRVYEMRNCVCKSTFSMPANKPSTLLEMSKHVDAMHSADRRKSTDELSGLLDLMGAA